jgi:lycopene cyclase domain-containing protein
MQILYVSVLLFSLIGLVVLDKRYSIVLFQKQYQTWVRAIGYTVLLFLGIDVLGVLLRVFATNPAYVIGIWILPGTPFEEVCFLVLVSYITLLLGRWRKVI